MSNSKREKQLVRIERVIAILSKRDPDALEGWIRQIEQIAQRQRDRERS